MPRQQQKHIHTNSRIQFANKVLLSHSSTMLQTIYATNILTRHASHSRVRAHSMLYVFSFQFMQASFSLACRPFIFLKTSTSPYSHIVCSECECCVYVFFPSSTFNTNFASRFFHLQLCYFHFFLFCFSLFFSYFPQNNQVHIFE